MKVSFFYHLLPSILLALYSATQSLAIDSLATSCRALPLDANLLVFGQKVKALSPMPGTCNTESIFESNVGFKKRVGSADLPVCKTSTGSARFSYVDLKNGNAAVATLDAAGNPKIEINNRPWKNASNLLRTFLLVHECSHFACGHIRPGHFTDKVEEQQADCAAIRYLMSEKIFTEKDLTTLQKEIPSKSTNDSSHVSGEVRAANLSGCLGEATPTQPHVRPNRHERLVTKLSKSGETLSSFDHYGPVTQAGINTLSVFLKVEIKVSTSDEKRDYARDWVKDAAKIEMAKACEAIKGQTFYPPGWEDGITIKSVLTPTEYQVLLPECVNNPAYFGDTDYTCQISKSFTVECKGLFKL